MGRFVVVLSHFPALIAASLQVKYPLNQQYPPVAQVGAQYQFQFAPTTFESDSSKLQYSLINSPSWLSLDSKSRTLSGKPGSEDIGQTSFTIVAAGEAGSVLNLPSNLYVVAEQSITARGDISKVLSQAGAVSGPTTVTILPSTSFNITFPPETFSFTENPPALFATLSDHTPLPAWLTFDTSSRRFTGTTPSISTSQSFEILLIASVTPGFASATVLFTINLSNHQLEFNATSQTINATNGGDVLVTDLNKQLLLDKNPIESKDLRSMTAKLPPWLSFNSRTYEIYGTVPMEAASQDLVVTGTDQSGDTAQLIIHLNITTGTFSVQLGTLNITLGEQFHFEIPKDISDQDSGSITFDFASLAEYLTFDESKFAISGLIPQKVKPHIVTCTMVVSFNDGLSKEAQTFRVNIVNNSADGSHVGKSDAESSAADDTTSSNKNDRKKTGIVVGAVVGAVCGALLIIGLALCLLRRRGDIKSYLSPKPPRSPRKSEISKPMPLTTFDEGPEFFFRDEPDLEKGHAGERPSEEKSIEQPPKIDLQFPANDWQESSLVADTMTTADTRILDAHENSSWGLHNDITPSQHPHDSMRIPTELAKRSSRSPSSYRKHKRRTTTVYQDQIHRSNGLPVNRRITGAGHGRHTYSPSKSTTDFARAFVRRPLSTSSHTTTRCTSILSTVPSAFPQPALARHHTTVVTMPTEVRRSIRIVPGSTRSSIVDRRTLDEKRNSYIRKRASAQSPFFNPGTARISSANYKSPPAFIADTQTETDLTVSPTSRITIVRPSDEVEVSKENRNPDNRETAILQSLPKRIPAGVPRQNQFPGSLRRNRADRPLVASTANYDRIEKLPTKTAVHSPTITRIGRRASTRDSSRAFELKTGLNHHTGSEIFTDAELSDSVYTDEEEDIEEAERRTTMRPGQYTIPPLKIETKKKEKRMSATNPKIKGDRESRRELKRTSERDPTPYFRPSEHGGKENQSSTYSLGLRSSPERSESKNQIRPKSSPEKPKAPPARRPRPATEARRPYQGGHRLSNAPSRQNGPPKDRHSRKSIHSQTQFRNSQPKKQRDRSRTQSSAFPHFDPTTLNPGRSSSIGNAITTSTDTACRASTSESADARVKFVARDLSGNFIFYPSDEEHPASDIKSSDTTAALDGPPSSPTLPPPPRSSLRPKRTTMLPSPSSSSAKPAIGLGLFPLDTMPGRSEMCERDWRERTPLSTLQGENRATPEPTRADEERLEAYGKGRQTWGSLKSVVGRGSRWFSGSRYWDTQGKDDKVFL